ncbi:MAG: hypothetical protein ACKVOK_10185 [Flavobacteriales bacterium]
MSTAYFTKTNRVVKNNNFSNPIQTILGKLSRFIGSDGNEYRYFSVGEFKQIDIERNEARSGYYNTNDFQVYLHNSANKSAKQLLEKDFPFNPAQQDDIITAYTCKLDPNETAFYRATAYTFIFDKNASYFLENGTLNISLSANSIDQLLDSTLSNEPEYPQIASNFFLNHLSYLNNQNLPPESKLQYQYAITKLSLLVYNITKEVFPTFVTTPDNTSQININALIHDIKTSWNSNNILNTLEISAYAQLYVALKHFYSSSVRNKVYISNSTDAFDKLIRLLTVLPESTLALFSKEYKLKFLEELTKDGDLNDAMENLAIKVLNSVTIDNQEEVNFILNGIISKTFATNSSLPPYHETTFSRLYNGIQNYKPIVKGTAELFGSDSYSHDNKRRFATVMYLLWSESLYNPYKNLDEFGYPDTTLLDNGSYNYDQLYQHYSVINYKSHKNAFGIYEDIFTFSFNSDSRGIYFVTAEDNGVSLLSHPAMLVYQPVTLLYYPSENDTSIQMPVLNEETNALIPLFYLKYIDDDGDASDFETKIGLLIDVVTTLTGVGNLAKLRHLRQISKLGQVLLIIETLQISAGILSFLLNFIESCDDSSFCKKLKTVLFYLELSSLVTDPIAIYKAKKSAKNLVDEGIENGWPNGMLTEMTENGVPMTPKQKIEALADLDIDYLDLFKQKARQRLKDKLNKTSVDFDINRFSDEVIDEVLDHAANKGLSLEDSVGILHQASRKKHSTVGANDLKARVDNLLEVRRRKYPFTFSSAEEFNLFIQNKIQFIADKFHLPKRNVRYGGSSVTHNGSLSGDPIQDTDFWFSFANESEFSEHVDQLIKRYNEFLAIPNLPNRSKLKRKLERLQERLEDRQKNGRALFLEKEFYIGNVSNNNTIEIKSLADEDWLDELCDGKKIDISMVIADSNIPTPSINLLLN